MTPFFSMSMSCILSGNSAHPHAPLSAVKKMNKKDLIEKAGLAKGTVTRMGKNESVTVEVLVKICNALDCDVYDVLEIR